MLCVVTVLMAFLTLGAWLTEEPDMLLVCGVITSLYVLITAYAFLVQRNARVIDGETAITVIDAWGRRRTLAHADILGYSFYKDHLTVRGTNRRKLGINMRLFRVPRLLDARIGGDAS